LLSSRTVFGRRSASLAALALVLALLGAGCGGSGRTGDALAVVSSRDGDYALYGMDADGSHQGRLTEEKGDLSTSSGISYQLDPAWSPDGRRIAFASAREGTRDIFVMDATGQGARRLTKTNDDDANPTWSPDGQEIAFHRGNDGHVYVMSASGGSVRRLTKTLAPEREPAWSPDGRWIAYTRRSPGTPIRELWLVHPDGSGAHGLTTLATASFSPAWSPDSKTIAFAANPGGERYGIYTIGVDGKGLRTVSESTEDAFEPAWSADGETIAFSRDGAIITVDLEGNETQITDADNNDSSPAWNPSPIAADEAG
jgi:Tol biopolymer transport system component